MAELLEKIPPEKRWALTAKALIRMNILRAHKFEAPLMGKDEGITAPIWGYEKLQEILNKLMADTGMKFFPWIKERFNILVEDAIGAAKLCMVAATLGSGPGQKFKIAEETHERVVLRTTRCEWWEIHKELEIDPGLMICPTWDPIYLESGIKAVNPKITFKFIKFMPRGEPYCEEIYEFKEE
jgi:hypothetical protein